MTVPPLNSLDAMSIVSPISLRSDCKSTLLRYVALGLFLGATCFSTLAQTTPASAPVSVERESVGDAPDNPGPLATGISSELKPKAIDAAMKKVADWQIAVAEPHFNKQ